MQRLTIVRYTTNPEDGAENERLSHAVFDELRANASEGVAYAVYRDGDDWVHVFANMRGDDSDAVTALPSFAAYAADIGARCSIPPKPEQMHVSLIDSYGFPA